MQIAALLLSVAFGFEATRGSFLHKDDPEVVVHTKEAGNGYLEGSPLYKGDGKAGSSDIDLTCTDERPPSEGGCTPPVSTTMKCVINLAIQYFILYSALAGVRSFVELSGSPLPQLTQTLSAACMTVNYAAMLSVLFLGTRMRAVQLSGGKPDDYGLPQWWVKMAMWICVSAVQIQTIIVLALPFIIGGSPKVAEDGTPELPPSPGIFAKVLGVLRWVTMIALYGGFTTVCIGAYSMEAPEQVYPAGTAPPVSPAVACTMNLAMQYFGVYLAIQVVQTYAQFQGTSMETRKLSAILQLATNTVNFAPMLSILFIGARMRALQIDPKFGNPQPWAQNCFYLCAYSVMAQLMLVIVVPYVLGGEVRKGEAEGDVTFELANPSLYAVMSGVRYLLMLALYGGFTAVIVSVFTIEAPEGETTPPIAPAMQCVINLTAQFFFVYLMLWVLISLRQLAVSQKNMAYESFFAKAIPTMEAARATVQFAPMLSVLFLGLRLRALQITGSKGQPQKWAQDGMFLATYAVLVQMLMVFLTPLFTGGPPKMDDDGNVVSQPGNKIVAYTVVAIRYAALLCLYGGAITCVVALFKITPSAAMRLSENENLLPGGVSVPAPANPADTVADAGDAASGAVGAAFFF
jgi:hypothetical protein